MTDWRRFHRAAVCFELLRALKDGALPVVVLIVVGGRGLDRALAFLAIGVVAATVLAVVRWTTTEWRLADGAVRRRSGLLSRQERSVPLGRVQSVDAIRGPLQRLFGVETLHVQSGGGKGAEVVLTAVAPVDADALRAAVAGVAGEAAATDPEVGASGPVRRLRPRELLLAALTSGQAGAVVAVAAAVAQVVNEASQGDSFGLVERLAPDTLGGWLRLAALALAAFWAVAVAGALVAFSGFTLSRDGDRLRIRRGLLFQRDSSVPVRRVQAVRVVEGVLRQPLGLAAVRIETLGYGDEPPANQTLFPLVRRREVGALLEAFLPEHADGLAGIRRPPARALAGYLIPPAAVALALAVAAALVLDAWWPLVAVVPAALLGAGQWSAAGWRLDEGGRTVLRWRRLARSTLVLSAPRAQTAVVGRSVLQRRAGLATVAVSVGPATGRVRGLPEPAAWRLWSAVRPSPAPGSR